MNKFSLFRVYPNMSKTKSTKPRAAKGKRPARRGFKKAQDVPDFASLSVTRTVVSGAQNPDFLTNTMYTATNVQLADYPRAAHVSQAYQHYRIKKITLRLKPTVDTFAQGGPSKNYLYYMIDKAGSIPTNATLELLKQMGAKAHVFDERQKEISWRPSVLADTSTNPGALASSPNKYMISPWLSTNANVVSPAVFQPSTVDHLGVYWMIQQQFAGGYGYVAEIEVQFEFKKPVWVAITGSPVATPIRVALEDNSADGIVETPNQ